ncbi:MAG TPA: hypothetical protein VLL97_01640, partial [Acidobacteriota bacterium]|nr:hypothetical protein [Acidobacteriota bacterium]
MNRPGTQLRRNRENNTSSATMSKLRTPDALKTVLDDPRQLEEILKMLEDQKIGVRQTAAATL